MIVRVEKEKLGSTSVPLATNICAWNTLSHLGYVCNEPSEHNTRMCLGAVRGRAESPYCDPLTLLSTAMEFTTNIICDHRL